MEAAVIVTYRCQSRCRRCRIWKYPTRPEEEFAPGLLQKLPRLSFCNITGGEPFLRDDIGDIVRILRTKARRTVISTNGLLTEKILALAGRDRSLGIRVSLEGLAGTNDSLRGIPGGFERGLETLRALKKMGLKDIGLAVTVSDENFRDLPDLHRLAKGLGLEFATAAVHNSFYFHTEDNALNRGAEAAIAFEALSAELLKGFRPKTWFRAYFNAGLANYVRGAPRPLPCGAGRDTFFLDPYGEILPCNGMEKKLWFASFGNLKDASFDEIWNSDRARGVREQAARCPKNCWMIGTAGPAMKRHIVRPALWVLKNKLRRRGRPG